MNLLIDDAIYNLQTSGGISTLWRELTPYLHKCVNSGPFDPANPVTVFLSTYYQPAPMGAKSIVVCYDWISSRYPLLSRFSPDTQWKYDAIEKSDAVVAISRWTADDVTRYTGKTAAVAYPSTSLTRAPHDAVQAFKAKYNLPDTYLLVVGRRGLYKNVSSLWQALKMFNPRPFVVCVGGEEETIEGGVRLVLTADELSAAYTGALCLVYPSLYEGFGLPVLEAYACGCPVVCGDGGALKEINAAACVVDVTRPRELVSGIVTMMDHGARIEFILMGYREAKRFSWAAMAETIAQVIQQIAEDIEL